MSSTTMLPGQLEYLIMGDQSRNKRRIFAVIGLLFVGLSVVMTFVAPGSFWNWGLLLVALGFLFLSRRAA
jgi:hypothetical protein